MTVVPLTTIVSILEDHDRFEPNRALRRFLGRVRGGLFGASDEGIVTNAARRELKRQGWFSERVAGIVCWTHPHLFGASYSFCGACQVELTTQDSNAWRERTGRVGRS